MRNINRLLLVGLTLLGAARSTWAVDPAGSALPDKFSWNSSPVLLRPADRPEDPCYSVKDPTVVRFQDRWHVFMTIRSQKRSHQIEYVSFADWADAGQAERHVLTMCDKYFCAPQVFYFTPQKKWYMTLQVTDPSRKPALQPAFATNSDLSRPDGWTKPELLYAEHPDTVPGWIDFWVICDAESAHLFFTSNNNKFWHAQTKLSDFPRGFDKPRVVLQDDLFEASHTYKLKGRDEYLTVVEAQNGLRRYYKAYTATKLAGDWKPLAASRDNPFASSANVRFTGDHWAESISHGELLRTGCDERLEVDPDHWQFLYQGATDAEMRGKPYGQIPWKLGLLTPDKP